MRSKAATRITSASDIARLKTVAATCVLVLFASCAPPTKQSVEVAVPTENSSIDPSDPHLVAAVTNFCGDCHAPPDPQSFPQSAWPEEVRRGFEFYTISGRRDLSPPDEADVTQYYQALAPERLQLEPSITEVPGGPVRFQRTVISWPTGKTKPGVSHLLATDGKLLFCDALSGAVGDIRFTGVQPQLRVLMKEQAPAQCVLVDLDSSGEAGLLIADLGTFGPEDHERGRVVYQKLDASGRRVELLSNVGRVAGVAAADLDGDGQLDVAVAEFGWHETGGLHVLWNASSNPADLTFEKPQTLDARHGASHVFVCDLDEDGDQDLVTLHSQEFESVDVYLNEGRRVFERRNLFTAHIPEYGSSCIELCDLDSDGDIDILLTNGDSLDSSLPKPYHGLQWLENRGQLSFVRHELGKLPGVYGATGGDLDGDGDLDIAACTMTWDNERVNTLVWFEQQGDRTFVKHCLDHSIEQHACLELGDFDNDGDLDIAVGEFEQFIPLDMWSAIWWNMGHHSP